MCIRTNLNIMLIFFFWKMKSALGTPLRRSSFFAADGWAETDSYNSETRGHCFDIFFMAALDAQQNFMPTRYLVCLSISFSSKVITFLSKNFQS